MIYKFRMISNEVDEFYRDFVLKDSHTFFDFHNLIQEELNYDKSQLASFFTANEKWEKNQEISLYNMDDPDDGTVNAVTMDQAIIGEYIKEKDQQLLYEFDFFLERTFFIKVVDIYEEDPQQTYPGCIARKGNPPEQTVIGDDFPEDLTNE